MLLRRINGLRFWRDALAIGSSFALLIVLLVSAVATPAAALPAQLPSHFAFGVSASPGDTWMPQTGIAWDYRMQYLVGGVNTGSGWETWNPNGQFALWYAQESAQHGYIPLFPYYELLQSSGSCGSCNENQKDITNLNTPSLMAAYYQNFALLMKRLGPGNFDGIQGFGKTALVNIEPDFAGGYAYQAVTINQCFGFCTGQGNDPSLLKASVASTGVGDVAGYPNTYAGYVRALAHLRDVYAPNVMLGLDVSMFATGADLGMDTNPNTNAAALGQQVGVFLGKTGPHELLFNNPLDRDAGQYKAVFGQNRWWDRQNVSFPNFRRWEQYLQATSSADGGKSMLLWQVPVGNQYFATENNTNGHYQDNRAEYIFSHIPELIQAGVVGAVFASGNAGNTTYMDSTKDGVTNPGSFCTSDGTSSAQICNTHTSTVSDDDGGFIRMSGQAYYQKPVSLSGVSQAPTSTATATVTPAQTATPTRTATSTPTRTPTTVATNPSPTATRTAAPASPSFSSSGSASPSSVSRGASMSLTANVKSTTATKALIDVEVYGPTGAKVFQQFWDNQSFSSGQTRSFNVTWSVPASASTGSYTVKIGVFASGWGTLYNWNNNAAAFTVM